LQFSPGGGAATGDTARDIKRKADKSFNYNAGERGGEGGREGGREGGWFGSAAVTEKEEARDSEHANPPVDVPRGIEKCGFKRAVRVDKDPFSLWTELPVRQISRAPFQHLIENAAIEGERNEKGRERRRWRNVTTTYRSLGVISFQLLEEVREDVCVLFIENAICLLKHFVETSLARGQQILEETCEKKKRKTLYLCERGEKENLSLPETS